MSQRNLNIAIFASGNGSNFEAIVSACREGTIHALPALCVCDLPGAPVIERAQRLGIPLAMVSPRDFPDKSAFENHILSLLAEYGIDLICLAGYMRIVGAPILNRYRGRILNIHPSLLPDYKGAHAIRDAFEAGESRFGVTVHHVVEEVDEGKIIAQEAFNFKGDNIEQLETRIHSVEHTLYPRVISDIIRKLERPRKILVVGSGGRCHAIVEALARSQRVGKIFCAPGNPGIAARAECIPIRTDDISALADFAEKQDIDLTVVGPEAPLCAGIADEFHRRGLRIFAPSKAAAAIEGSKLFAKQLMEKAGIPTAPYRAFDDYFAALQYVRERTLPVVVKYNGLAAGKGVVVARSFEEAEGALREMLVERRFGPDMVLIEDFLEGREFSFMCFVNGRRVYPLAPARDYKRAFEGDRGPNTGGMGAYSPVEFITPDVERRALDSIMNRAASALADAGIPFTGVLYGGLILTSEGPKVVEFNARFGDPETEVVLMRLESDLLEYIEAVFDGRDFSPHWSPDVALGIVLAAQGYPGSCLKGMPMPLPTGLDVVCWQMGTSRSADGRLVADGGRVMMVAAKGTDREEARSRVLEALEKVASGDFFFRKDIGL